MTHKINVHTELDHHLNRLLFSKVFHDLVSPLGALLTSTELLQDMIKVKAKDGAGSKGAAKTPYGDMLDLIQESSQSLRSRIDYFRLCFGSGGGKRETLRDLFRVVQPYFTDSGVIIEWDQTQTDLYIGQQGTRLLLCSILMMRDLLPRGGTIDIYAENCQDEDAEKTKQPETAKMDRLCFSISALGENARITPAMKEAFYRLVTPQDLNPHTAVGYYTAFLADLYNVTCQLETKQNEAILRLENFVVPHHETQDADQGFAVKDAGQSVGQNAGQSTGQKDKKVNATKREAV